MAFDDTKRIQLGSAPNDGNGETLRSAGGKINSNFEELYGLVGAGGGTSFVNTITSGTGISVNANSGNVVVTNSAPYVSSFTAVAVLGQSTALASSSQVLTLVAGSNVTLTTSGNNVTIAAATQQQANWTQSNNTAVDYIKNKPTIPAAQIQSDWNQATTSALDYIKNKPTDLASFSDAGNLLGRSSYITDTQTTSTINPSASVTIYSGVVASQTVTIKAHIIIAGPHGSGTTEVHTCEILIARSIPTSGFPTVQSTVFGTTYTSVALASFTTQWNSGTGAVEIVATNLSSTSGDVLQAKVVATQYL
jgi:hypothetical protein